RLVPPFSREQCPVSNFRTVCPRLEVFFEETPYSFSMKKILNIFSVVGFSLALGVFSGCQKDSTSDKIQNDIDDAVKDTKQEGRELKRELRDRTGQGSVVEDMKDKAKDL